VDDPQQIQGHTPCSRMALTGRIFRAARQAGQVMSSANARIYSGPGHDQPKRPN